MVREPPRQRRCHCSSPTTGTASTHHFVNTACPPPVQHTKVITNHQSNNQVDAAFVPTDRQRDRRFALRQRHRPVAVARPRLELPAHHHGGRVGAGGRSIQHSTRPQRPQREAVVVGQQRHPVTVLGGVVEGYLGGTAGGQHVIVEEGEGAGGGQEDAKAHNSHSRVDAMQTWVPPCSRMGGVVLPLSTPAVGCKGLCCAGPGYMDSHWLLGGAPGCLHQNSHNLHPGRSPPPSCAPPPGG